MRADLWKAIVLVLVVATASGCAAGRAFSRAERAARAGDWDLAVQYYTQAVQASPQSAEYKIALERAQLAASRQHLEAAAELEAKGDLEGAIREYRRAADYDASNNRALSKAVQLEQTLRDRLEAARPKPAVEQLRERARAAGTEPTLNPASRDPLRIRFGANTNIQDILSFIGQASGINILYDREVQNRPIQNGIELDGVTLEQALNIVLTTNGLFYKVLNEKTILVIADNPTARQRYDEQVVQTFYVSNADPAELVTLLNAVMVGAGGQMRPSISQAKSSNTITVRGTAAQVAIAERVITQNDKPRAEIVIDVEILEVNRQRAKQYGLNLSAYQIGGVFSPEGAPTGSTSGGTGTGTGTGTGAGGTTGGTTAGGLFNLNTLSRGINTSDFYLQLPSYTVRFLESDTQTKLVAKPSLRGAEGAKLTLNLGDDIPVPSTTFLGLIPGGVATSPSVSFNYRSVGVNLEATPRVTLDNEIILDLSVEISTRGGDVNISGQNLPSFGSRKVTTRMRLRDGESNLLAGLLRDDERKSLTGFPGAIHVPFLKQLFSANDTQIQQTDIVMLMTPHIIRTQGLTERDFQPIYIGTAANPSLGGGPPPLIAPTGDTSPNAPAMRPAGGAAPQVPGAGAPSQVPGTGAAPQPGVQAPPAGAAPGAVAPAPGGAAAPGAVPPAAPRPGAQTTPPAAPPGVPGAVPLPPAGDQSRPPLAAAPAGAAPPTGAAPAGTTVPPGGAPPAQPPAAATQPPAAAAGQPPAAAAAQPPATPAAAPGQAGAAQVLVTPPGTQFTVGGGPYTVPISINNVSRVSTLSLTIMFTPRAVRVRSVQEGSFMRQGGINVAFAQQVDPAAGRIDITISRGNDAVGASGSGLLATLVFDAEAPGTVTFTPSGLASGPAGAVPLQFAPATVTVK